MLLGTYQYYVDSFTCLLTVIQDTTLENILLPLFIKGGELSPELIVIGVQYLLLFGGDSRNRKVLMEVVDQICTNSTLATTHKQLLYLYVFIWYSFL